MPRLTHLFGLAPLGLLLACGGDGGAPPSRSGAESAGPTDTCARKGTSCKSFEGGPGYLSGQEPADHAADLPPPPAGASLCGSVGRVAYYLSPIGRDELFTYYEGRLTKAGYLIDPAKPTGQACDWSMTYRRSSGPGFAVVTWHGDLQAFDVGYLAKK